jgi:hypothetical protein
VILMQDQTAGFAYFQNVTGKSLDGMKTCGRIFMGKMNSLNLTASANGGASPHPVQFLSPLSRNCRLKFHE